MAELNTTTFGVDRRRRLLLSLEPVLSKEQLWQALWIWELEFAVNSPFDVSGYAQRLATEFGIPGSHQALLDQITQGIQAPANLLPADPVQDLQSNPYQPNGIQQAAVGSSTPSGPPASPPDAVFNGLLREIMAALERQLSNVAGSDLLREVRRLVRSSGGDPASWGSDPKAQILGLSKDQMSQVLNGIYVWICEELGPTKADPAFGAAIRAIEQLPQAAQFPPRQLL